MLHLMGVLALFVFSCSDQTNQIEPTESNEIVLTDVKEDVNDRVSEMFPVDSMKMKQADSIVMAFPGLYPEGITFNPWKGEFYVSSVNKGIISSVDFDGNVTPITEEGDLIMTVGMKFLPHRQQIAACHADGGFGELSTPETTASLAEIVKKRMVYNNPMMSFSLEGLTEGPQFPNDLTFDSDGNLYITDSFSPLIYKVDKNGIATVFAEDAAFETPEGNFGLNGIEWHPDGFLIVAKYDEKKLFKISVSDPSVIEEISIPFELASPDGILLTKSNTLLMVCNSIGESDAPVGVYKMTTEDNWASVQLEDIMETPGHFPTTLTQAYKDVYVLYGDFEELILGGDVQEEFIIKRVTFDGGEM